MTTTNISTQEIMNLVRSINTKKELLKAVIETSETIQAQMAIVKEAQEELKALIAADEECASLQEDIKSLSKELNEAAKTTSKHLATIGIEAKPAVVKAYFNKKVKDVVEVDKVIQTGSKFNVLKAEI